jgi:hypothetical protein
MPRPVIDRGKGRLRLWLRPEIERWKLDRAANDFAGRKTP